MTERVDGSQLPQFPTDVSAQNCAYAPVEIEGVPQATFLAFTSIEPNQVVAQCVNPLDKETLSAESRTTRMAVVTVNPATGEVLPATLARAADGAIEVRLPADNVELRLLLERPGDFYIAAQHNGTPLVLEEDRPGHYTELLSSPKDEHPQDPRVVAVAQSIGMNPSHAVEVNGRFFYAAGAQQPVMEPLIGRQDAQADVLTVQVIKPVPQNYVSSTTRGISFGAPQPAQGSIDRIGDRLMLHGHFQVRVARM